MAGTNERGSEEGEGEGSTARLFLSLPADTIKEIMGYVQMSGLARSHFLCAAMVIGARVLARQLSPEQFMTPQLAEKVFSPALSKQVEQMMGDPEQLKAMFRAFSEAEKGAVGAEP